MSARPAGHGGTPPPVRVGGERRHRNHVVVAVLAFSVASASIHDDGARPPGVATIGLALLAAVPLRWRDRRPLVVFGVVVAAETTRLALMDTMGDVPSFVVPIASLVACYTVACELPGRRLWPFPLLGTAALVGGALLGADGRHAIIDALLAYHSMIAATLLGGGVRNRAQRVERLRRRAEAAEQDRHEEARRQVMAERLRIARDVHDVLAHHITLVNAQAGVAGYLLDTDPAAARHALHDIAEHTREALQELRATVGLLRSDEDAEPSADRRPAPGLHRIGELVETFRAAGTSVSSSVVGVARPLSALADLAAYRIVQETLTNASKHAPGAPVSIVLTWSPDVLDLLVVNGPAPGDPAPAPGTGNGLLGMQERALAAGGALRVERPRAGGFLVAVSLPTTTTGPGTEGSTDGPLAPGMLTT